MPRTDEHDSTPAAGNGGRFDRDPGELQHLLPALAGGALSAVELVQRCLDRIDEVESDVQAWRVVDADGALATARALDHERAQGALRGPLHGVPVAIKDVIDCEDLATRCNSRAREQVPPAPADAEVVAALRAAGAVIMGKVHTTEFAFFDPSPARNPHNTAHTPGGSSSGSAAAVAAGMVPAALGTQTVASVNRPAAYCGVAAFKPSSGLLSTFGVTPLAPMYDTVGFFGRRVADAAALFEAVCPAYVGPATDVRSKTVLDVVRLGDDVLAAMTPAVATTLNDVVERLQAAGHRVRDVASPVSFELLREQQWRSFEHQMSRVHRGLLDLPQRDVGVKLREAIEEGLHIEPREFVALRAAIVAARQSVFGALAGADAVLWPAAPGTAPEGLAWTGDPRFVSPWTALGGPVVTVPAGKDAAGLPIGVLLTAPPGTDRSFCSVAARLAEAFEV